MFYICRILKHKVSGERVVSESLSARRPPPIIHFSINNIDSTLDSDFADKECLDGRI